VDREIISNIIKCEIDGVCLNLSVKQEIGQPCRFAKAQEQSDGSERSPTVMLSRLNLLLERKDGS